MKIRFDDPGTAQGFAEGLGAPDEFDVVATYKDCVVEILGLDDHPMMRDILECAATCGGKQC